MKHINLAGILRHAALLENRGITFIQGTSNDHFLSYKDLYQMALRALFALQRKGIRPKDEVVFQIEDNKTFVVIFWACILGNIIPVPVSVGQNEDHKQKLFNIWDILNNPFLLVSKESLVRLNSFAEANGLNDIISRINDRIIDCDETLSASEDGKCFSAHEDDIAFIQFSSGSTGSPKGVILNHNNLILNMQDISNAAQYTTKDSTMSWMPLTHDMGLIGFHLNPMMAGMNQYLIPTQVFVRKPSLWFEKTGEHKVTVLCSPNFGFRYAIRHCNLSDPRVQWDLSSVRLLYNGAEPISSDLCVDFTNSMLRHGLKKTAMRPVYGLAEASLAVTISTLNEDVISMEIDRRQLNVGDCIVAGETDEHTISIVNVGKPIEHCEVRIVNEHNGLLDDGTLGHIQIRGGNVTRGYYNNDGQTKTTIDKWGWLRTGDLGFLKDGHLYITGRAKDIIFVNGQNFYPHDIERVAEQIPEIELNKIAVVGFFSPQKQKDEKVAFVFHRGNIDNFVPLARSLYALINTRFGIELDEIIPVSNIPRTTSGKLQRFKLLQQYKDGLYHQVINELRELTPAITVPAKTEALPLNELEEKLLVIWKEILKVNEIGVLDGYFETGGNSLNAAELAIILFEKFGVEITFEMLYKHPTIRAIAEIIGESDVRPYVPLPVAPVADRYPLTSAQRRIYFASSANPTSIAYNVPVALRIDGSINIERLEYGIKQCIRRHASLRTNFVLTSKPESIVHDSVDFTLSHTECIWADINTHLQAMVKPFNLSTGPLFRMSILKTEDQTQILFADFHHIISDGRSILRLLTELGDLYAGKALPISTIQFKDYAAWEMRHLQLPEIQKQKSYWLESLTGELPLLEMPTDFTRTPLFSGKGRKLAFKLNRETTIAVRSLARQKNCTSQVLLYTIYIVLLRKYSGQSDIIVGVPAAGRRHRDLQDMQGMFVNNLAIRNTVNGEDQFSELLERVRWRFAGSLDNQDYPFESLVSDLDATRDTSRNPVFDTMFIYQEASAPVVWPDGTKLQRYFFDPQFAKFDISVEVFDEQEAIRYYLEFATDLFQENTIRNFGTYFASLVEEITRNPDLTINEYSIVSDKEYKESVLNYNATEADYPHEKTIDQLFEAQALKTPTAIAIDHMGTEMTYAELRSAANRFAFILRSKGIGEEDIVGIMLDRSPEMIIAILGTLRAGACYLPLDGDLPEERLNGLISNSQCGIVISDTKLAGERNIRKFPEIILIDKLDLGDEGMAGLTESYALPCGLAYVIYTSGTTGGFKGVMIEHEALVNYTTWAAREYVRGEQLNFAFHTSVSFDLTITSVFTPLITGNRIVVYAENGNFLPIEEVVAENKSHVVKLTPSHLKVLLNTIKWKPDATSKIRRLIVGGEQLETRLAAEVYARFSGDVEIFNEYGPTEATVGCMIHKFDPDEKTMNVPIGRPAQNTSIYILDETLNLVPTGVNGELYISGDGIARGYLFQEGLSEKKFLPNPFREGQRMYKTGDVARRMANGAIIYIGRADNQLKIKGYRVELSEIENAILTYPGITQAVASTRLNHDGQRHICGYFTTNRDLSASDLSSYLAERLPAYMIPRELVSIDKVPLTRNGKIDYRGLPEPELYHAKEIVMPANKVEESMLDAWKDILGGQLFGTKDNFFELGGDSIKAVQIASRLYAEGISVTIKDILVHQTIERISRNAVTVAMESHVDQGIVTGKKETTPIESWFFGRRFQVPGLFNQSILLCLSRPVPIKILEDAFKKIVEHHDGLRLNAYPETDMLFFNDDHLVMPIRIPVYELEAGITLEELCERIKGGFDLASSLLIRPAIINDGHSCFLFITAHHMVTDGVSWRVMLEDLYTLCTAALTGTNASLPPKTISLQEWSRKLSEYAASQELSSEESHWQGMENSIFSLIQDFETSDWSAGNLMKCTARLSKEQTAFLLTDANGVYKTDTSVLLITALAQALQDMTGLHSFVIEQENHGRQLDRVDASRTIGWLTSMYPVKIELCGNCIGDQVKSIREQLRRVPRGGIGYGICKQAGKLTNEFGRQLSEVRFNYLGQFDRQLNNDLFRYSEQTTGRDIAAENEITAKLEFNLMVIGGELIVEICYNRAAYKHSTIGELSRTFVKLLERILDHLKADSDMNFETSHFAAIGLKDEELNELFSE